MRLLLLTFSLLCALILLGACKPAPSLATDDAKRITEPEQWGASLEAQDKQKKQELAAPVVTRTLPANLPSPELFATSSAIYAKFAPSPASAEQKLINYREIIPASETGLDMIAIPGGKLIMGSPPNEPARAQDEGPQHEVEISPFWISSIEIPWEIYTAFMENARPRTKAGVLIEQRPDDELWDAVTQPTAPYTSMNLGMGHGYERGMPAIAMSHYAASKFCEWLSAQTGRYYRLPTEAEWEYACRAGSQTAYCYGNSEAPLDDYAWYWDNAQDKYQRVASKKPNQWGLYDMHGNVAEWVLDSYKPNAYQERAGKLTKDPMIILPSPAPHLVRGGSWDDDPDKLRSATRRQSSPSWNMQDPQNPKSLWYLTDGGMIGFRIVRPVKIPDPITVHRLWNASKGAP
ncbi:MAG: SUMF1/EgtB/PvdO family nonheme iron enzyme [Akkermansia sp.]